MLLGHGHLFRHVRLFDLALVLAPLISHGLRLVIFRARKARRRQRVHRCLLHRAACWGQARRRRRVEHVLCQRDRRALIHARVVLCALAAMHAAVAAVLAVALSHEQQGITEQRQQHGGSALGDPKPTLALVEEQQPLGP